MRQCPPRGLSALFIFCGIEPRIQRERAQHFEEVAVTAAVDAQDIGGFLSVHGLAFWSVPTRQ
jgi:hypothetical protein